MYVTTCRCRVSTFFLHVIFFFPPLYSRQSCQGRPLCLYMWPIYDSWWYLLFGVVPFWQEVSLKEYIYISYFIIPAGSGHSSYIHITKANLFSLSFKNGPGFSPNITHLILLTSRRNPMEWVYISQAGRGRSSFMLMYRCQNRWHGFASDLGRSVLSYR